jgi:hypothetical protein
MVAVQRQSDNHASRMQRKRKNSFAHLPKSMRGRDDYLRGITRASIGVQIAYGVIA